MPNMRLLILLAVLGIISKGCLSCTCNVFEQMLKPGFCLYARTRRFAIKAKVVSDDIPTPDGGIYYKIKSDLLKFGNVDVSGVYLTKSDIECGTYPKLNKDEEHLIMGTINEESNRLHISLCAVNKPWSELTKAEKRFLEDPHCLPPPTKFPDYLLLK